MKLSISNIAWSAEQDTDVYKFMQKYGFTGLEIAPTRIFPENPYDHIKEAESWICDLRSKYRFEISSMQSIWYGRQERIFGSKEEREDLIGYTKKAIDFAAAVGCKNLVFGCPGNRKIPDKMTSDEAQAIAVEFFHIIGDYALKQGTVIGMEANPPIYNTNFINTTSDALSLIQEVDSNGFKLNLDVGTMIQLKEDISVLIGNVHLINHVHMSEPYLQPIQKRTLHNDFMRLLCDEGYDRFISIEMSKTDDLRTVSGCIKYLSHMVLSL